MIKTCKLCKEENEDKVHFLTKCSRLENIRDYELLDRNINNYEERMRELLFRDNRCYEVGKMIKDLWILRRKLLKEITTRQLSNTPSTKYEPVLLHSNQGKSDPGPRTRGIKDTRRRHRSLSKG